MVEYKKEWFGKKVADYDMEATPDFENVVYRIGYSWDDEVSVESKMVDFFKKLDTDKIEAFIFGSYGECCDSGSSDGAYGVLLKNAGRLPNLKGLFFCDAEQEDTEISWIEHGDIGAVVKAFPNLEELYIRGGGGLNAGHLKFGSPDLKKLKKLVIETGGLSGEVVRDISSSEFPELEHLELWLGTDEYGGSVSLADLETIFNQCPFPKLQYLGIKNAEEIDTIAPVLANALVLKQLKTLDVSLGVMTDEGGKAFVGNSNLGNLESIDFHHHFMSDAMMKSLQELPCKVDVSDQEEEDRYDGEIYRYIAVSE